MKAHAMKTILWTLLLALAPTLAAAQTKVEYYHVDAIGSVRAVTDSTGNVVRRHDYAPFGEELATVVGADKVRFSGKERDAESALDYFGARYLQPKWGRFSSVDPALGVADASVEPQLWNRYSYVTNNPIRFRDYDGRERAQIILDNDIRQFGRGQITQEELTGRLKARGAGALAAAAVVFAPEATLAAAAQAARSYPAVFVAATRLFNSNGGRSFIQGAVEFFTGASAPEQAVLGPFPSYLRVAKDLGAHAFNVPTSVWNRLTRAEQWQLNKAFLDQMVAKGVQFVFSVRISEIKRGSFWWDEVEYLRGLGYEPSDDGFTMVKK